MPYRPQQVKPKDGFYAQTKVCSDGSHYIAIPHTERPYKPRRKPVDEFVTIQANAPPTEDNIAEVSSDVSELNAQKNSAPAEKADALIGVQNDLSLTGADVVQSEMQIRNTATATRCPQEKEIKITKKQLFEQLYKEYLFLKRRERRAKIIETMRSYFDDEEHTALYVDMNLDRKRRNLIVRRIRLIRKANLPNFNYFVTFTYDSALHTEDSFKKKLKNTLGHFSSRKSWRYIGVWERSPEKKRLHFHGVFDIPTERFRGYYTRKAITVLISTGGF